MRGVGRKYEGKSGAILSPSPILGTPKRSLRASVASQVMFSNRGPGHPAYTSCRATPPPTLCSSPDRSCTDLPTSWSPRPSHIVLPHHSCVSPKFGFPVISSQVYHSFLALLESCHDILDHTHHMHPAGKVCKQPCPVTNPSIARSECTMLFCQ